MCKHFQLDRGLQIAIWRLPGSTRKHCHVCVCGPLLLRDSKHVCRGAPREQSWLPNEEGYATADVESDQLHVPASCPPKAARLEKAGRLRQQD